MRRKGYRWGLIYDIWYGLYSKIPWCCVKYFVKCRVRGVEYIAFVTTKRRVEEKTFCPNCHDQTEYVTCDECNENHRVEAIKSGRPNNILFEFINSKYIGELKRGRDNIS